MIRRDYIMKLIQQLSESLFLLSKDETLDEIERQNRLQEYYKDYLGTDIEFLESNNVEIIILSLRERYGDELLLRVEMLSDIMYVDATSVNEAIENRKLLLQTLHLLSYVDDMSDTYSLVRQGKIDEIRRRLDSVSLSKD